MLVVGERLFFVKELRFGDRDKYFERGGIMEERAMVDGNGSMEDIWRRGGGVGA